MFVERTYWQFEFRNQTFTYPLDDLQNSSGTSSPSKSPSVSSVQMLEIELAKIEPLPDRTPSESSVHAAVFPVVDAQNTTAFPLVPPAANPSEVSGSSCLSKGP